MSPAGRPEIGAPINIRLPDGLLRHLDAYAAQKTLEEGKTVSRAEAIRRLLDYTLTNFYSALGEAESGP